ncbi:MAG TPA: hypothetical protein VMR52_00260 [Dehalococcoidia bacterium]|nr:hypothetical protein [Dehalococcoidia bacterium]
MERNQAIDRAVTGVAEGGSVWTDALRAGNDRMYRLNRIVIDEAERTQDERAELFRSWMESPTDMSGFTTELLNTWTRRTRRRIELARTLMDDVRDLGAGTRSLWARMSEANREAAGGTAQATRQVASEVTDEAADLAGSVSKAANNARRGMRKQANSIDPN